MLISVKKCANPASKNVFLQWANPCLFFVYFQSFQTNNTILTTNQCEKCLSGIRRWDLNPKLFEQESAPITTRPGLLPTCASKNVADAKVYSILNDVAYKRSH